MTDLAHRQLGEFLLMATNALALPFEASFQPVSYIAFARNNWPLAFGLVIGYMVAIFGIQHFMAERKPFVLRLELAAWNAFLCVFSFIGMCKTLPYLFGLILTRSFEETVCENPMQTWGVGSTGLWVMLFIFSKIPELVDTIFIVLRKKPLIFLHYYHHVTVLLFCWSAYSSIAGSGLYFVAMNYTVHALMYGYYCLQALNVCPKSFPAYLITFMQIGQMFVGTGVCVSSWYYLLAGHSCSNDLSNLVAGGLMYGSYLYLFCEFAVRRYSNKGKKVGVKKLE
jgi:elongation of very long chain fatty acids protein 6